MFPGDPVAIVQRYQYMFGDSLLVAPVVTPGQTQQNVYLPAGEQWIDVSSVVAYDGQTDGRFRISYSNIIQGGQSLSVSALLQTTPMFVRAGSIIPSIDPSVYTLNHATGGIISIFDRADLLHLWVWPDQQLSAAGSTWEPAKFNLVPCSGSQAVQGVNITDMGHSQATSSCFSANDPLSRTLFVQIISANEPSVSLLPSHTPVPQISTWQELVIIEPRPTTSAWAYDGMLRTVWLRLMPADVSAGVQLQW
jgi:hypothetical protein